MIALWQLFDLKPKSHVGEGVLWKYCMILVIRKDVSFAVHNVLIGAVNTTRFMGKD